MTQYIMTTIFDDMDHYFAELAHNLLVSAGTFFTPVFNVITFLGNMGWAFVLTAIIMLLFKKTRKAGCIAIIAMVFGFLLTNIILKYSIARQRPYADITSNYYLWWKAAGSLKESEYSFPSGHATVSTCFAFSLFLSYNKKISWLYLIIPLIMGFTRIYFVVHYSSDVFGGYLVGTVCSIGGYYLFKYLLRFKLIGKALELPSICCLFKKKKVEENNNL